MLSGSIQRLLLHKNPVLRRFQAIQDGETNKLFFRILQNIIISYFYNYIITKWNFTGYFYSNTVKPSRPPPQAEGTSNSTRFARRTPPSPRQLASAPERLSRNDRSRLLMGQSPLKGFVTGLPKVTAIPSDVLNARLNTSRFSQWK